MGSEPGRPTNESGRHPLPTRRPRTQIPQPRAASAALPAPQSTAMMRQTSAPYINSAAPSPYHNRAEADKDQAAAISLVNSGRQSSSLDAKREPLQQLLEAGGSLCWNGRHFSARDVEAAQTLLELRASAWVFPKAPPAISEPQPKRKRNGDDEGSGKKAKTTRNRTAKEGEPRTKPFKCDTCGETFGRNEHLVRHGGKHDEEQLRFECDICGHLHLRKDNLNQHRQIKHVDAGPAPVPRCFLVTMDDAGKIITKRPATSPASATADDGAQNGEGEADTIDSSAQPGHEEARDGEPSSSHTQNG
ncbi:hypothetical protein F5883DRAFT_665157 [Diaporthe sp. PMI_573]|nr:hypothetical protein F5883DRAFT_665157 [Diaporthaceae sp. PMI_573]